MIRAPYPGQAQVAVATDHLIDLQTVNVPEGGTTVHLRTSAAWGGGAYVLVSVIQPRDPVASPKPRRALGLIFVKLEPKGRKLTVEIGSTSLTLRELLVGDVGEGVAPPELQRFIEALTRAGLLAVPQCVVTARREGVEAEDIDGRPVDREHISIAAPRDQGRRAERPSQRGYLALECVHAPVGSRVAPEHFDEMIVGHAWMPSSFEIRMSLPFTPIVTMSSRLALLVRSEPCVSQFNPRFADRNTLLAAA